MPQTHGSYVTDIENDGDEDLLLIGGDSPVLFENAGGEFDAVKRFDPFESVPVVTAHFFDYDNSGYEDLLLLGPYQEPVLYENREGTFARSTVELNRSVTDPRTVTSADFTENGCLDLYIGSWRAAATSETTSHLITVGENHPDIRPDPEKFPGPTNVLFAGDCQGFEDITDEADVNRGGLTFAVSAADFTQNGHTDIHVGNDFGTDYIYENQGNASFEAIDLGPNSDRNAMSSTAMDVTGNHLLDIFVTNIYFENPPAPADLVPISNVFNPHGSNLFANQGNGEFTDIAPEHGLERGSWGWASTVADYNNDGHLDIIHASVQVEPSVVPEQPEIFRSPQVWTGTADSWEKVDGLSIGFYVHNLRGVTRVDYDGDGALDFVAVGNPSRDGTPGIQDTQNRTFLYENQLQSDEFVQLWVHNPDGIDRNAEIYVETDRRTIYRVANARSDFQSQDSRLVHVGLANEQLERVVVEWPDGTETAYDALQESERYFLRPDGAEMVE
jgi:hypothetical protein